MNSTYHFHFTEDEYWSIYEHSYPRNQHVLGHSSVMPYAIITLILAIPLIIMNAADQRQFAMVIALLLICTITALTVVAYKIYLLLKAIRKIEIYYQHIKNGVSITLTEKNLVFVINGRTTFFPMHECNRVVVEEKMVEFHFNSTLIMVPKSVELYREWTNLEADLMKLSEE